MEGNPHVPSSCPASGGLIHLQARLTSPITWLGPAWATLCGVIASGEVGWRGDDWLLLALLVLLVDAGWGTLWASLAGTNWAKPLRRWRNWRFGEPAGTLPYTLSGSPGDRASRWLGQLRAWGRDVLWPACGPALSAIVVALPVTALLAALLGTDLVLLSVGALVVMQLGLAWEGGSGSAAPGWDAAIAVALPWLAGHVAFGSLSLRSAGLALAFALAWGAAWRTDMARGRVLEVGAHFLVAALLVALHRPLAAGCTVLLFVPQVALLPWLRRGQPASWYVRHTRPWLMAAMLVAAWAL
jgi:hypothetical protein